MERLWNWLKNEPKGFLAVCGFISSVIVWALAWNIAMDFIVQFFGVQMEPSNGELEKLLNDSLINFLLALFFAAAVEEMIFRLPLIYVLNLSGSRAFLFFSILAISAIFGILHGGFVNILFQGADGVFFSVAFLKGGAFNDIFFKGLFVATFVQFLFNVIVIAIAVIF